MRVLVENGTSGLPVCDIERRVLGVISEGNILYKTPNHSTGGRRLRSFEQSDSGSSPMPLAAVRETMPLLGL